MGDSIDTTALEKLDFLKRVPVGIYRFSIFEPFELEEPMPKNYKDMSGFITFVRSGFKAKTRINFQIDHIIPMSKGGLTTLDNLQVLSRKAHAEKTRTENLKK